MKRNESLKRGDGDVALDTHHQESLHLTTSELTWVPQAEAQRLFGCSRASLYRWRKTYGLRCSRLGRKLFFELGSLVRVLEENAREGS